MHQDLHRRNRRSRTRIRVLARYKLTFDYADTATGEVRTGRIAPADRAHLADWPRRFRGQGNVTFAVEACTGTPWSCRRRVPDTSTRPTTRARVDGVWWTVCTSIRTVRSWSSALKSPSGRSPHVPRTGAMLGDRADQNIVYRVEQVFRTPGGSGHFRAAW
jgi:hypothetical protein